MTDPDLTTEVVGYRQWYITPDLQLRSCGLREEKWTRGDNTAVCCRVREVLSIDGYGELRPDPCGDCPGRDCECGFYALHDPSDHWYGKPSSNMWIVHGVETDTLVSGIVVAWGALQVHHQGFRSQHARIAALALPNSKRDQIVARATASAYGVPCVPSEELPRIAAEYGGTVPVEFRPAKPAPNPELGVASAILGLRGYSPYARGNTFWATTTGPQVTWTSIRAQPAPSPAKTLAQTRAEFIQAIKKDLKASKPETNRQGPPKPKRAPKKLGGR